MTSAAYVIPHFTFKHYKRLLLHVWCIVPQKDTIQRREELTLGHPSVLDAASWKAQPYCISHRSSNEAGAIVQDFLEKGESSTRRLQTIKEHPLSPNTTPLSRKGLCGLTGTRGNSDEGLQTIPQQKSSQQLRKGLDRIGKKSSLLTSGLWQTEEPDRTDPLTWVPSNV